MRVQTSIINKIARCNFKPTIVVFIDSMIGCNWFTGQLHVGQMLDVDVSIPGHVHGNYGACVGVL